MHATLPAPNSDTFVYHVCYFCVTGAWLPRWREMCWVRSSRATCSRSWEARTSRCGAVVDVAKQCSSLLLLPCTPGGQALAALQAASSAVYLEGLRGKGEDSHMQGRVFSRSWEARTSRCGAVVGAKQCSDCVKNGAFTLHTRWTAAHQASLAGVAVPLVANS
jgi:hypothetical protein